MDTKQVILELRTQKGMSQAELAEKDVYKRQDDNKDHKCDYCGKKLTEHTGGKATCKDKAKCEVCGAEYGEFDANNHSDLKYIDAKAATKDAEGNIEYWYCEGCGKYFSDKDGTKAVSYTHLFIEQSVTKKLDHNISP